jgi:predicted RND superfamily exporter protein
VLDQRSEAWAFYQESQHRFGGDEILTVLIEGEAPFDRTALEDVRRLTRRFEAIEGVWRVDSLASVPLVWSAPNGELQLDPGLRQGILDDAGARSVFRERVRRDRIAPRSLITADEEAFAINVVLEQGAEARYAAILSEIERAVDGRSAWISGVPVFRTQADLRTRQELLTFIPLTLLCAAIVLFVMFRSLVAVAVPLVSSAMACWAVLGSMGAAGVPITIATVLLPSIILALSCAYSMHLLSAARGCGDRSELMRALDPVALPVALSGLTTSIGFVAISAVRIDAIEAVGTYGALGVLVTTASTLTALPALLALFPIPRRSEAWGNWLSEGGPRAIADLARQRPRAIVVAWLLAFGLVVIGIGRVRPETDVIVWFPKSDPIRVAYEEIRTRLSGISPMNVVVEGSDGESVVSAAAVAAIDRLTRDLEALPEVGRAISISDPLRQLHGGFTGDPDQPLPGTDAAIAQYLLLLESKQYIRDLITSDRSSANVIMRVDDNGSTALLDVARAADSFWEDYGVDGLTARTTGIMYEFARAEDAIVRGQITGLAIAFGAIAVILVLIFRAPLVAMLALIPNVLPIGMAFGVMGFLGIPLDAGTVVVGSLALGVAVDDTIHLTSGFVRMRAAGETPHAALLGTLRRVLAPLSYTTIVVALGFSVLAVSGFTLTRNLGILMAAVMILCLAADLLLLPVLLGRWGRVPASGKPA